MTGLILTLAEATPCPWCGGRVTGTEIDETSHTRVNISLVCGDCDARGPAVRTSSVYPLIEQIHDAVIGWNTRGHRSERDWQEAVNAKVPNRDVLGNRE